MAKVSGETGPGRRLNLIVGGISAGLLIGGGLIVLLFFLALGAANWVRSQPEPAVFLMGDSMPPTLQSFDVVYLRPADDLRRGVIISYSYVGGAISHRIVGLPGETVEVKEGQVFVGKGVDVHFLEEPYVRNPYKAWNALPVTLGGNDYLTLGDNRAAPSGRTVHVVPRENIAGIVYRIIFPPWRTRLIEE